MIDDADRGGDDPCLAHRADELDLRDPPPLVIGSNTILYCDRWADVVDFYRAGLGLRVTMERDWFVEFELHPGAHVSVADADRATIAAGGGSGLTMSWRVDDIGAVRRRLRANDVDVSTIQTRWRAEVCFVFDPAGNRIEFWSSDA